MEISGSIYEKTKAIFNGFGLDITYFEKIRSELHQNAEGGYDLTKTWEICLKSLKSFGYQDEQIWRMAKTGIVVDFHGSGP